MLALLGSLPRATCASHEEVMALLHEQRLDGARLGSTDMHLLASTRLSGVRPWTRDRSLLEAAKRLLRAP